MSGWSRFWTGLLTGVLVGEMWFLTPAPAVSDWWWLAALVSAGLLWALAFSAGFDKD
ncbi:hypothetical protein [Streptomyces sp. NRRL B-1347]|uniref:hypothetical protein n=1 Tax=Streptomyces sp. NRRL B-1347 TaxID=1476877 RepID=UPI00131BCFD1|nr:hypothetical protein [Streptomyces sp. NRRL B-1347]